MRRYVQRGTNAACVRPAPNSAIGRLAVKSKHVNLLSILVPDDDVAASHLVEAIPVLFVVEKVKRELSADGA
jgi:hypothetical protein